MNTDLQTVLADNSTIASISTMLDAKDTVNQQLSSQLSDAQGQASDLSKQVSALKDQIFLVNTALFAKNSAISVLQSQLSDLTSQLSKAPLAALSGLTAYTQLHKWPARTTDNIEQLGLWIDSGGHTAQSNPGTNTTPHGTFTWAPGTDSTPARLDFKPGGGWDDIFIYERFPAPASLPTFVIDKRTFSLSTADRAVINCVEWQQEFTWNGKVYNTGWQWNFTSKLFRYFDYTDSVWKPANVPFVELGPTPVNVVTKFQLDEAKGATTHLSIAINGKEFPVNVTQSATPTTHGNKYTVSLLQLDADGRADPFGINIHDAAALFI